MTPKSTRSHPRILRRAATSAAAGGLILALGATAAGAAPAPSGAPPAQGAPTRSATTAPATCKRFATGQKLVAAQLADRIAQLGKLTGRVARSTTLTASGRSTLEALLASQVSGIDALASKVPSDTTCSELVQDFKAMIDNYRVYVVMSPQADLTIGADTVPKH